MKHYLNQSFRRKLLSGFLLIGIVPLLACTLLMLNIFRVSLSRTAQETAGTQLTALETDLSGLFHTSATILEGFQRNETVLSALAGPDGAPRQDVYYQLYTGAAQLLSRADFSLFDTSGRRVYSTVSARGQDALPTGWGLLRAARETDGVVIRDVAGDGGDCLRSAVALHSGARLVGYAVMDLTESHFAHLVDGKYAAGSGVAVLDPYWAKVYATPSLRSDELLDRLRLQFFHGEALSDGSGQYSYYVLRDPASGLFLLLRQPRPVADATLRLLYTVTAVTILAALALCVLVSMRLTRQLFEPIRALNSAMSQVEEGNLEVQIASGRVDEMGQLAGRFDRMVTRLKSNLDESLRQQRELSDAQIRMMQAQLNPHFLYNTLDTVKWMGKIHQVPQVSTIAADLAEILRSSISSDEFVPLEDELRLLERYVEIQTIRFSGKFTLRTQVEDDVLDVLVPKLMLQPLVENAIIHGFENTDGGEITVSARAADGELTVTVRDDGCGMSEESLRRFQSEILPGPGRHLGLHNVDAILRLHYGADHGLRFVPVQGGTCIRITLPIARKGETPC